MKKLLFVVITIWFLLGCTDSRKHAVIYSTVSAIVYPEDEIVCHDTCEVIIPCSIYDIGKMKIKANPHFASRIIFLRGQDPSLAIVITVDSTDDGWKLSQGDVSYFGVITPKDIGGPK